VGVCVFMGFVICGCVCVGVLVICVLEFIVLCCLYCVFVLYRLCIFIPICFVCAGLRTTATE
jgi:hypothetical protein